MADPNYPYAKVFDLKNLPEEVPKAELTKQINAKLKDYTRWNYYLGQHDMFKHLLGNPTSITMIAMIHFNP